jgi:hypothetical protein
MFLSGPLFSDHVHRSLCFVFSFRHLRLVTVCSITVQRHPNRPQIFFGYGRYWLIVILLIIVDITVNAPYSGPRLSVADELRSVRTRQGRAGGRGEQNK